MQRFFRNNGLSIVCTVFFFVFLLATSIAGVRVYNSEQTADGLTAVSWLSYLQTGAFAEAVFENWESEFFQMFSFILLTAVLLQVGSSESKSPGHNEVDEDPMQHRHQPDAPRIVRYGHPRLVRLYSHSLTVTFFMLWLCSVLFHAWGGEHDYNQEQALHNEPTVTYLGYFTTSQFWFESMQNYQSEFMVLVPMLLLGIWLRERGSSQSKPVHAPHRETEPS